MILVAETKQKYGYDPTELLPKSQKPMLVKCPKCERPYCTTPKAYRIGAPCKPCRVPSGLGMAASAESLVPPPPRVVHTAVLREETFARFGYYPEDISNGSNKPIVWRCVECENSQEGQERNLTQEAPRCVRCRNRKNTIARNAKAVASGMAPSGLPLGQDKAKYRETNRKWRAEWRKTTLGMLENRLRVSLKRVGSGFSTKNLPYTAQEFAEHIERRLEARDWKCPFPKADGGLCEADLHLGYDVDHRLPLAGADTEERMLELFGLWNLDVLCPSCNQFVKRHTHVDY